MNPLLEYISDLYAGVILMAVGAYVHSWPTWSVGIAAFIATILAKNIAAAKATSKIGS